MSDRCQTLWDGHGTDRRGDPCPDPAFDVVHESPENPWKVRQKEKGVS